MRTLCRSVLCAAMLAGGLTPALSNPVLAAEPLRDAADRRAEGRAIAARAIEYLRTQQDDATGGWGVRAGAPRLPAITGLVLQGMLMDPRIDARDEAVARGVAFVLAQRQADGGIYDRILPSYNTAICVSALARVGTPEAAEAVQGGIAFLRAMQWHEGAGVGSDADRETARVGRDHPFYGGVGYGGSSRPDNSNLHFFINAFIDAGVDCEDPAVQRALVFLERTQMHHEINDMPYAEGSTQGGFIYATSPSGDQLGVGESKGGEIEELTPDGQRVSRLRAYGSMTYAGFRTYIYAQLERDDPRVAAALDWIRRHYTLRENPGVGLDGYYYYLVTFANALAALGEPSLDVIHADGRTEARDWRGDLIGRLAELQNDDGSFRPLDQRWMEGDPVLITAYSLIALQHALRD